MILPRSLGTLIVYSICNVLCRQMKRIEKFKLDDGLEQCLDDLQ